MRLSSIRDKLTLVVGCFVVIAGFILVVDSVYQSARNTELSYGDFSEVQAVTSSEDLELGGIDKDQVVEEVKEYKSAIVIPTVGIKSKITEGTGDNMDYSVGHFTDSAKAGRRGNYALAGHSSDTYKCILNNIKNIGLGDAIEIYDEKGKKFTYYCTDKAVVQPSDMAVIGDYGDTRCTIVTCTEGGSKRLIIVGHIMNDDELAEFHKRVNNEKIEYVRTVLLNMSSISITEEMDNMSVKRVVTHSLPRLYKVYESSTNKTRLFSSSTLRVPSDNVRIHKKSN